jgi:hypothetical protein
MISRRHAFSARDGDRCLMRHCRWNRKPISMSDNAALRARPTCSDTCHQQQAGGLLDCYLTGPMVNKRFNISAMTRWRWENDPRLQFPVPIKINNRSYFKIESLLRWESNRPSKTAKAA